MPEDRVTFESLSAGIKREVQNLKRPIAALVEKFSVVRESLKEYAPKIMKLYNTIAADNTNFTFVDFVRFFAPDLPTHSADRDGAPGYRSHKVYYTMDYMRRMATLRRRGVQGVRDSALDILARSIATLLQVKDVHPETVWSAVQKEFNFGPRKMTRLRKDVAATKPLFELVVKGPVKVGPIVHMEPLAKEARASEPLAQKGRRVKSA